MDLELLRSESSAHAQDLMSLRRALHRTPELGFDLPKTRAQLLAALDGLPLEITTSTDHSGIVAVLRGASDSGPVVLLRGDMDALPLTEQTGLEIAVTGPTMHACGHDLHSTMLVGAARLLCAHRDDFDGAVVFMFQPAEELGLGANRMIDEGVLVAAGRKADAAYALHVTPSVLDRGTVATRAGTLLAAVSRMMVTVRGAGGHASRPHRAADPIAVMAEMLTGLQVLVTRQFDAFDPVVITVGHVQAGTRWNVIPDTAYFEASMRTFSMAHRDAATERATRLLQGIAEANGMTVDVEVEHLSSTTVNDDNEAARVMRVGQTLFGEQRIHEYPHPQPGSEDFAFVLEQVPGALAFLGACPPELDPAEAAYNHSPLARYDDSVASDGAALLAALAIDRLQEGRTSA